VRKILLGCFLSNLFLVVFSFLAFAVDARAVIDWSQPPVACVEEIVPSMPNRACLDLSGVTDPLKGFPGGLEAGEERYWLTHKPALQYCRAKEIMRRESANPGSQSSGQLEVAWMRLFAVQNFQKKIDAVYEASRTYKIPAQVLTGALFQESIFAELGIAEDGGNYSCGVGQINISEWCRWATRSGAKVRADLQWPRDGSECSLLAPSLVKPFFDIAKSRLERSPEYKLSKAHFANIAYQQVSPGFPQAEESVQRRRYLLVKTFVNNCSDAHDGILAKAHELATIYRGYVPAAFKKRGVYPRGQGFQRNCAQKSDARLFPLHLGWLLAVGVYNAGPRAIDSMAYYNGWSNADLRDPETLNGFSVVDMVKSLYWAGEYNHASDRISFTNLAGTQTSWIWYKPCVLQRHMARVVQHVTSPGVPMLVDTLEGVNRCAKSKFDPVTGVLIQSAVPRERQTSSGRKDI
jgi:hypothetical protein